METNQNTKKVVIENLIALRKQVKLTQVELAKKINYSDKAISRWENGEVLPDIETLELLSKIYDVNITYFFEHHDTPTENGIDKSRILGNQIAIGIITLCIIWTLATIVFVYAGLIMHFVFWQVFVWAIPVTCLYLLRFNHKVIKSDLFNVITRSIFCWSLLTAIYLQMLAYNPWLIYLVGIPTQAAIVANYVLRKLTRHK